MFAHVVLTLSIASAAEPPMLPTQPDTLTLSDGRTLAWIEVGDPRGHPVLFFHGGADSRLESHLIAQSAMDAGVRLIAPDRPGFGASSVLPDRTFSDWTTDVVALADHLQIDHFDVVGHSGGGPLALVVAAQLPERVERVAVVAGAAPREAGARRMVVPFRVGRWLSIHWGSVHRRMLESHRSSLEHPERFLRQYGRLSPGDDALFKARPDVGAAVVADMAEGYTQGVDAAWHESRLYYSDWGFSLGDVQQGVRLYYSEVDPNAAPGWGPFLAERLPDADLTMFPDEGHISILVNRADDVFAELVGGDEAAVTDL